ANPEGRFWGAVVRGVLRRPGLSLGLSVAILLAAASPLLGMHVGTSGVTALPDRFESKRGFLLFQRPFPTATAHPGERGAAGRAPGAGRVAGGAGRRPALRPRPDRALGRRRRRRAGGAGAGRPVRRRRGRRRP